MTNLERDLNNINSQSSDNIFDLKIFIECFLRRRKLIFSVASSVLFLFFCYAFASKKVWQGEFEIVLNKKDKNSVSSISVLDSINNSTVRNLLGSSLNLSSNINTEVEILKSKSVLMPIFDYVKNQKELNGQKSNSIRYEDWVTKVNVSLKPRTSVLTVSYKDLDKDLILPVITKISNAYKEYPGRDKNKSLKGAVNYFDEQISIFTIKSEKAYRDYISFALENNLSTFPSSLPLRSSSQFLKEASNISSGSAMNVDIDPGLLVQNKIKELEMEKKYIESLDLSQYDDQVLPLTQFSGLDADISNPILIGLQEKVLKLSELRNFFTEEDRKITNLKNDIRKINKKMHINLIEIITNQIKNLYVRLDLVSKPDEVVIKSKEMQREWFRLDQILVNLENSKQVIALQLAEKSSPWELISKPFMSDDPVAPKKKQIVLLGFFTSIIIGGACALYADRYSGLIYNLKELKSILNYNFLNEINLQENRRRKEIINLIGKNISDAKIKNLGLALVNEKNNDELEIFTQALKESMPNVNIIKSNNLLDLSKCEDIILLVFKGKVKREELFEFNQKFKLLNKSLLGWIFFSNS